MTLHGFVVGPGRCDERLVAEGAILRFEADLLVTEQHVPDCECELLWAYVVKRGDGWIRVTWVRTPTSCGWKSGIGRHAKVLL